MERASHVEGLAAAAAPFFIGIDEGEAAFELLLDEIHLRAEQEHDGLGVDQHLDSFILHHLIVFVYVIGIFDGVGQARAAARADADADTRRRLAARVQHRLDAGGGFIGDGDGSGHVALYTCVAVFLCSSASSGDSMPFLAL